MCAIFIGAKVVAENRQPILQNVTITICDTNYAYNSDGSIFAEATCCQSFAKAPTGLAYTIALIELEACAADKLEKEINRLTPP